MQRYVKEEHVANKTSSRLLEVKLGADSKYYLDFEKYDVGSETRKILKEMKADKTQHGSYKTLGLDIRKFFDASATYLMKKLPLSNVLLKNMACLSPLARMQPETVQMISAVIDQLPLCHSVRNIKDNVVQE